MPITEHQLQNRRKYLGSSDAAPILGRSPWKTRTEVYYDKVLDTTPNETTEAMETGNRLENPLIDFCCERLGVTCVRNQFRVSHNGDGGIMAANLDALINDRPEAIEAKYTGNAEGWGESGTDEIPVHYVLQVQHQMAVAQLERVWVPVFYAASFRPEWRLYCVPRNQDIIDVLTSEEVRFWREHVELRIPPGADPPPMEMLRRLIREPQSTIDLDESALAVWAEREAAAEVKRQAESAYEQATAKCLVLLGDNEVGSFSDGRLLTYSEENAGDKLIDSKQAKMAHPELFQSSVRRVLRLRKSPKAKK